MRVKGPAFVLRASSFALRASEDRSAGRQGSRVKVINNHKRYKINKTFLKKIVSEILKYLRKPQGAELEVIFLDDASIRRLNRIYKKKDVPTDVLSFGIDRSEFGRRAPLGEIFISLDRTLENSKTFGTRFEEEAVLYVIHGILHLFGYDDERAAARRRMSEKEREILKYLWKREDLSKVLTRP